MVASYIVEAVRASLREAFLVGGGIRDSLMGLEMEGDLDFATPLPPEEVKKRLLSDGFSVIDFSAEYGTISSIISMTKVEITTFRQELYDRKSRKPGVSFISSLEADLARRDFTMNAIAHDGESYIDPYNGQGDILNKKIRAVGDPLERFTEDPLRILRAMRFVSTLGFTIEGGTYDAMVSSSPALRRLSGERISSELNKLIVGNDWVRAVSVGIETKAFDYIFILDNTDVYYDDFLELLRSDEDKAQTTSLTSRWTVVILALVDAIANHQAVSRGKILNMVFERLRYRLKWSRAFAEALYENVHSENEKSLIDNFEKELSVLKQNNDTRSYIVEEKLLKIKIRTHFVERNFTQVFKLSKRVICLQNNEIEFKIRTGLSKDLVIKESSPYVFSVLSYICACELQNGPFISTESELRLLINKMSRQQGVFDLPNFAIGSRDRAVIIENALISLSRVSPGKYTLLTVPQIMEANDKAPKSKERIGKIKNGYVQQLISLRQPPLENGVQLKIAALNEKIAGLILDLSDGQETPAYYSHLVDVYKWRALDSRNKKDFWMYFEKMNKAMDTLDSLHQPGFGGGLNDRSGQFIDSAQCLAHLLSIEKDITKKIDISRSIMFNYFLAGAGFERNVPRYKLLQDWLTLVQELLQADHTKARKILKHMPQMPSYNYVDEDEEYVMLYLPEVNSIRTSIKNVKVFLDCIYGTGPSALLDNEQLNAASILLRSKLIDGMLALEILRLYIRGQVDKTTSIEPISFMGSSAFSEALSQEVESPNLKLISDGESETCEFKESWKYNTLTKDVDRSKEVKRSAIKAMASFMNSGGGYLFLGVNDKGEVTGLEDSDFAIHRRKNWSRLQLQDDLKKDIDNSLVSAMGETASTLKEVHFDTIESKTVAVIKVAPSSEPVFYEDVLYVRSSASSLALKGVELYKFLRSRIPNLPNQT